MTFVDGAKVVKVKTTLPIQPYPPHGQRPPIRTERLILRPLQESDAEAMHILRTQPEVMQWTYQGKPDADMAQTKTDMARRFPPNDVSNYDFAICLGETDELIGLGGSNKRLDEMGWPAVGYMLRTEAWGKGYGTEFLKAWLEAWWALPRHEVEIEVDADTVNGGEGDAVVAERFVAGAAEINKGSHNVLKKCGFQPVKTWEDDDGRKEGDKMVICGFVVKRPLQEAK